MKLTLAIDDDSDDPMLSLVNLIDVLLVVIAALLLCIANNPLQPLSRDKVTVIRNAGQPDMEIITMEGKQIQRFRADGKTGSGQGSKAGTAYRMADGSLVYIPD